MDTDKNRFVIFGLNLLAIVVCIYLLKDFKTLLLPLILAFMLFLVVDDAVQFMTQRKIPRFLAALLIAGLIFLVFYFTGLIFYGGVAGVVDRFPFYASQINKHLVNLMVSVNIPLKDVENYVQTIQWNKIFDLQRIGTYLSMILTSFTAFFSNLVLILLFLFFMLVPKKSFIQNIAEGMDRRSAARLLEIFRNIKSKTKQYLLIKTAISIITALVGAFFLAVLGSDFVIFFAVTIFILNFIPTIGSIIATIAPLTFMFFKFGFGWRFILLAVSLMATQFIIGNILEPTIAGKMLRLSPLTILLALIFWGGIWSITGMFLALPLTVALVIVLENVPSAKVFVKFLKGE